MEQETFNFESTWTLPNAIPDNPEADMREVRRELQIIRQRYTAGALLYPRGTLRDMSKQLKAGHELIAIRGWDGKVVEWPRILKAASDWTPAVAYKPIEVIIANLYANGDLLSASPLGINWIERLDTQLTPPDLEEILTTFQAYESLWYQGEAHHLLVSSLSSLAPTKVVGLAAGSVIGDTKTASFFQHAAVRAIARTFGIKAYCQDPIYTATDRELLDRLDVDVLDDPDAILEIDRSTIVLSICPSIAVKQIVADDQEFWPMAMVWNRVKSVEEEMAFVGASPYNLSADPAGCRVRTMLQHYTCIPMPTDIRFRHDEPVELCVRHG